MLTNTYCLQPPTRPSHPPAYLGNIASSSRWKTSDKKKGKRRALTRSIMCLLQGVFVQLTFHFVFFVIFSLFNMASSFILDLFSLLHYKCDLDVVDMCL